MSFPVELADGRRIGELPVARWFARRYLVDVASDADQARGIDLWVRSRGCGLEAVSIEVKAQRSALDFFFLETRAAGLAEPGWVFTTEADFVALVESASRYTVLARPSALRSRIGRWSEVYPQGPGAVRSSGRGRSSGVRVPWHELEAAGRLFWFSGPVPPLTRQVA